MQRLPTWYLVVCLFLLLTLLSGCPTPEERAEEARAEARHALETGQRAEAVAALKRLRATQPDTPEALNELVGLLIQAGEAPQAVWVLEEGLERFPERDEGERAPPYETFPWDGVSGLRPFSRFAKTTTVGVY